MSTNFSSDTEVTSSSPSVSWPAIWAGATVAGATSLVLVALGSGLGLASTSPWPGAGVSAGAFTVMAGIWLIIIQWLASAVGGYITGRLRTRWVDIHTDEVFFRDTAHGFVMWALSTLLVAVVLVSAGLGAAKAAASAADAPYAYEIDALLRSTSPGDGAANTAAQAQVARILTKGAAEGKLSPADSAYIRDLVATRAGLSPAEAQRRVDSAVTQVRTTVDEARKSASATGFFTALSLLIGAFIACVAAALGGRLRDHTVGVSS